MKQNTSITPVDLVYLLLAAAIGYFVITLVGPSPPQNITHQSTNRTDPIQPHEKSELIGGNNHEQGNHTSNGTELQDILPSQADTPKPTPTNKQEIAHIESAVKMAEALNKPIYKWRSKEYKTLNDFLKELPPNNQILQPSADLTGKKLAQNTITFLVAAEKDANMRQEGERLAKEICNYPRYVNKYFNHKQRVLLEKYRTSSNLLQPDNTSGAIDRHEA